ncbi:hypothetical protein R84B8_03084 [Treponema sp. R8-4-B8]
MKNAMTNNILLIFIALAACIFSITCQEAITAGEDVAGNGGGLIAISIGGGNARTAYLPWAEIDIAQLDHTITFTGGPGADVKREGVKAGQTVQFSVTPGHWLITVKAYLGDTLVAEGSASVDIRQGHNDTVLITMRQVENKTPDEVIPDPEAIVIETVNINILVPVNGDEPQTTVEEGEGNFTVSGITWVPPDNPFLGNVAYKATVTLTAKDGYTFTGLSSATINGNKPAVVEDNTGTTVTLSYTFPITDPRKVTNMVIKSQPTKTTYTHGDQLNLSGLVVKLTYDTYEIEDVEAANFEAKGLTATPAHGQHLVHSLHNGKPVKIQHGIHFEEDTGNLTVSKAEPVRDDFDITGDVTVHYNGEQKSVHVTPKDGKSNGDINIYYEGTGDTTYAKSEIAPINAGTYAVTFDVGAGTNYNASTTSFSAGTLTINKKVVEQPDIYGVTVPTFNRTPVAEITATEEYTGEVAWSPTVTNNKFAYGTPYTATITLILNDSANYTFAGIATDFFRVDGANSVIFNTNDDTVTAVFPEAPFNVSTTDDWSAVKAEIIRLGNGSVDNIKNYTINIINSFETGGNTNATFGGVTFINVTITGDKTITLTGGTTGSLLYVGSYQNVVIHDTDFEGNSNNNTSLIYIGTNANLTMEGNSSVFGNTSSDRYGGGVYVYGTGATATFTMKDNASVHDNKVDESLYYYFGGGVYVTNATFNMIGGEIKGNKAGSGGGVCVIGATFNMTGGEISGNTAGTNGGGVAINPYTETSNPPVFKMSGGTISGNTATNGGGVSVSGSNATFRMETGTIYGTDEEVTTLKNKATTTGAALYKIGGTLQRGTFDSNGEWQSKDALDNSATTLKVTNGDLAVVSFNVASTEAWSAAKTAIANSGNNRDYIINILADIPNAAGTTAATFGGVTGLNVTITGNHTITLPSGSTGSLLYVGANQAVVIHDTGFEGNSGNNRSLIYLSGSNARLTMEGSSSVFGNTSTGDGGGVFVSGATGTGATFTMKDSASVHGNKSTGSSGGGGVYLYYGVTFTMQGNSEVHDNTSSGGGGVYFNGNSSAPSTFTMEGSSKVHDNTSAGSSGGGGVYVDSSVAFTMNGYSSVHDNTATSGSGGGVSLSGSATFNMNDNSSVHDNTTTTNGGGVYGPNSSPGPTFNMNGNASVYNNTAGTSGGGVYFNAGTINMRGGEIYGNNATGTGYSIGGGGVYSQATFNMTGGTIYGNTATGNGGGVCLSTNNSSKFQMETGTINGSSGANPNTAASGAALYKGNSTAQYGTFSGGTWIQTSPGGTLDTTANTIRVKDGDIVP